MITRISGTIEHVEGNAVALSTAEAVWYEVLVPAYLAQPLAARAGEEVTFATIQYLESQNQGSSFTPRLIGFADAVERRFFELFTTVKGIGNRKALRALAIEPRMVARAIAQRDTAALKKLPEIGARLAETIVAELHGKVDQYLAPGESIEARPPGRGMPVPSGPVHEAIAALIALGEDRARAEQRITRAADHAAAKGNTSPTADDLVALAYTRAG